MSTVLSTPGRQETIEDGYPDIGMGSYFEGFGVVITFYDFGSS